MRKKRAGESIHPQSERYRAMLLLGFTRFRENSLTLPTCCVGWLQ
jgi:hypothetical protein